MPNKIKILFIKSKYFTCKLLSYISCNCLIKYKQS